MRIWSRGVHNYVGLVEVKPPICGLARKDGMNHSMYGADRATHLKIVVIGLICALVVAVIGVFAHVTSTVDLGTAALVKAGRPTSLSGNMPAIR
jgi:hypothetical protein